MAKKKYTKWTTGDLMKIQRLRADNVSWTSIAIQFNTTKDNVVNIYRYYKPMLEDREMKIEKAIDVAVDRLESRGAIFDIRHVRDIVEVAYDEATS